VQQEAPSTNSSLDQISEKDNSELEEETKHYIDFSEARPKENSLSEQPSPSPPRLPANLPSQLERQPPKRSRLLGKNFSIRQQLVHSQSKHKAVSSRNQQSQQMLYRTEGERSQPLVSHSTVKQQLRGLASNNSQQFFKVQGMRPSRNHLQNNIDYLKKLYKAKE